MLKMKRLIVALITLNCSLGFAQFSEAVLKTSRRGLKYQEIVVTAKGEIEKCIFFSCTKKEVPMNGLLWLPANSSGVMKLVVFSHGAQGPTPSRPIIDPDRGLAGEFFQKGYAVLMAYRKGRVVNDLPDSEVSADDTETNSCKADLTPGVKSAADDLKAYLRVVSTRRDIDSNSILLMGHSRGGVTSLKVAADGYPGVVGVINISGGWITPNTAWGEPGVCNPNFNPSIFEEIGNKLKVPVLSLYGSKDPLFDVPHIEKNLSFLGKHAFAESLIVEGADHNAILGRSRPIWEEKQTRFLNLIGLK
jgi:dienelactone hydrolase